MADREASQPRSIAFIGGGRMAQALAAGFCHAGLVAAADITAFDPVPEARDRLAARVPGVRFAATGATAAAAARLVVLAVKPQQAAAACAEIAPALAADATLVSIVAGLPVARLAALAGTPRVVRVMPNTPSLVGRGVSVVCAAPAVPEADRNRVVALLAAVGHVHEADESLMDAVTGLSGSGPGFLALVVEALAAGGVRAGLPADLALALAVETFAGTGALLEETRESPAAVRAQVTSPGGTTLAGLAVLESRDVAAALAEAVVAATARARELGRAG
ncbi:MAG: pyrroline-5-carboxylate reductase [Planctomycetaceae bacterium]